MNDLKIQLILNVCFFILLKFHHVKFVLSSQLKKLENGKFSMEKSFNAFLISNPAKFSRFKKIFCKKNEQDSDKIHL